MFAYISGATYVLQDVYGLSPQGFSGVFAVNSVGIVTAVQVSGRLVGAGRVRPERMLPIGLAVAAVGSASLLVVVLAGVGLPGVVAGLFATVCGVGLALPSATTLALADHPEQSGAASALLGTAQFLVGAAVAPLVGLGGTDTAVPMAAVMAGMTLLALVVFLLVWRAASRRPGNEGDGGGGGGGGTDGSGATRTAGAELGSGT
jgi:DHA1 family bicyclomycin/chloramphenicol resistance-like MFS transporter